LKPSPLITFKKLLNKEEIETHVKDGRIECSKNGKAFSFKVSDEGYNFNKQVGEPIIPLDYIVREPDKIVSLILSKLQLNQKIFARKCEVKKVDKETANHFLNHYHMMHATQSASNYGLYFANELLALASFSKGRKMNRLKEHERSFELIRFCCKSGISVTGGLTRLIKHFCEEKKAGDIMTYIDKQISDGQSFLSAGFKKHSETNPNYFLINKFTFERLPWKAEMAYDSKNFYLTQNSGNIKLVFTPRE